MALRNGDGPLTYNARTALGPWEFAETSALAAFRALLFFAGYFGVVALFQGEPLSWDLVDQVTNRTLGVVFAIVQMDGSA